MQMQHKQSSSLIQEKITLFSGNNHMVTSAGIKQIEETRQKQITPAKRQKMETKNVHNSEDKQMDSIRVGFAQQATPKP
jgi:hypothetical protein